MYTLFDWLTLPLCNFACFCLPSADFCLNIFFENFFRVPNILDTDEGRRFVGPELGPNGLQRLSAESNI